MKKIKICGLKRAEDILMVNEAKPDYIGFVFAPNRKRTITPDTARELKLLLHPSVKAVGVFLNQDVNEILQLAGEGTIDMIQLHGDENEETIRYLRHHTDAPIMKAVNVRDRDQLERMDSMSEIEYLLLDTYDPRMPGGTGKTFDWSVIPKLNKPFFLAGGLNSSNILAALQTDAFALDISSGVETNGWKDPLKIKEIIKMIREG